MFHPTLKLLFHRLLKDSAKYSPPYVVYMLYIFFLLFVNLGSKHIQIKGTLGIYFVAAVRPCRLHSLELLKRAAGIEKCTGWSWLWCSLSHEGWVCLGDKGLLQVLGVKSQGVILVNN